MAKKEDPTPWKCVVCGKPFATRIALHSHIVTSSCGKVDPAKPISAEIPLVRWEKAEYSVISKTLPFELTIELRMKKDSTEN